MSIACPIGGDKKAGGHAGMELNEKVRARNVSQYHYHVINIQVTFKKMVLETSTMAALVKPPLCNAGIPYDASLCPVYSTFDPALW